MTLYRTMKKDVDGFPKIENSKKGLGVKIAEDRCDHTCDIISVMDTVYPFSGGMSTIADDPAYLPAHRKPLNLAGKSNDTLYIIDKSDIPSDLRLRSDGNKFHILIEPKKRMVVEKYLESLQITRNKWKHYVEV